MNKLAAVLLLLFAGLCAAAQPVTFTYTTIPDGLSDVCGNQGSANGINQRGDIAGRCAGTTGPVSLFFPEGAAAPPPIDFSSAFNPVGGSTTRAINDRGDIVSRWFDDAGYSHGYLLSNGAFSVVDVPNSFGADNTDARGINNAGTIVGFYTVLTTFTFGKVDVSHGFVRGATGTYASYDYPGADATSLQGVNSQGDIVGAFYTVADGSSSDPTLSVHAFILKSGGEAPVTFDPPTCGTNGAPTMASIADGINEQGQIVGWCTIVPLKVSDVTGDNPPVETWGFVRSADGTTYTPIIDSDSNSSLALPTHSRGGARS
jgi:uncharacterized membrane protein